MNETNDFSTPMMLQYMKLKDEYPDCLLWFRLGDFYEMFLDHAKIGSEVLGITLTSRSRGKDGRIPMAGIPHHAADSYLFKLIAAGYKVAICEQIGEANGRTLVEREVIRIVTPGTVLDEKILHHKKNNYILSVVRENTTYGVAVADLSTGEFHVGECEKSDSILNEVLTQFSPVECILSPELFKDASFVEEIQSHTQLHVSSHSLWNVWIKKTLPLISDSLAHSAAAGLLGYLEHTQKTQILNVQIFQPLFSQNYVHMDRSTTSNLEIFQSLHEGKKESSLLYTIDKTVTAMGARLLAQWLHKPLVQKGDIEKRLETVTFFLKEKNKRQGYRDRLRHIIDIERVLSRISVKMGTPRDIKNLADSLDISLHIIKKNNLQDFIKKIRETLIDQPPIDSHSGHFIREGISPELDEYRNTVKHSRDWMMTFESDERKKTGIATLKVKFNHVFGFYIEVSNAHVHRVPEYFTRKQTLVNAERFTTPELKHHEEIILTAEEKMIAIEHEYFLSLVERTVAETATIQKVAHDVAELDCLLSYAQLAEEQNYCQPAIRETGELFLKDCRHPVVENLLLTKNFVPNTIEMNTTEKQLVVITGPNMAGKSVLMRQVALTILLAHIGSYVPAREAVISLTDKIFVRSGAADMISAGLSTFMVEMVETAYILKNATEKSFIIMDEIGRGTSTYDGISIAWAVAEYIVKRSLTGPKTLFATHYHELQKLSEKFPDRIQNYHMLVTEHEQKPVFLYTFIRGSAPHSYGIAVAQLAGIPASVIEEATLLLHQLENEKPEKKSPVSDTLDQLSIEKLTPLEALTTLAHLKKLNEQHV